MDEKLKNSTTDSDFSAENASVTFVDGFSGKKNVMKNAHVVVASSEIGGKVGEICREMNAGAHSKIPLELSLIVASNDVFTADSLVYAENNRVLVSGVGEIFFII